MKFLFIIFIFFDFLSFNLYSQQNIIFNPSFEIGTDEIAFGWFYRPPYVDKIKWQRETNISHTGNYSISVERDNSNAHSSINQVVKIQPNKIYKVKAFVKGNNGLSQYLIMLSFWRNGKLSQKPDIVRRFTLGNADWTKSTFLFVSPSNSDSALIMFELLDPKGKIYFDDISLEEFNNYNKNTIAINCGSSVPYYYSKDSTLFCNDNPYSQQNHQGYIDTKPFPDLGFGQDIIGGSIGINELYYDARYGFSEYRFDVENGLYAVQLHFCENQYNGPGFRQQTVTIENKQVLKNFDIIDFVGKSYVVIYRFLAEVNDNQLNVYFSANNGNTMLSALTVTKINENSIPPTKPVDFNIINGFNCNILNWEQEYTNDFSGFWIYRKTENSKFELINKKPYPLSRYIDYDVEIGKKYSYKIVAVDLFGNKSEETKELSAIPVNDSASKLPVYKIFISDKNFHKLNEDIYSDEYVSATFSFNGKSWTDIGIRYRGNVTQKLSKKNYKIKFNEDNLFNGVEKLNLNATMSDPSIIIDPITYSLRRDAETLTQDTKPIHLELNNKFIGVYQQREQEDKYFLENHKLYSANIYRSQHGRLEKLSSLEEYEKAYEKETNTSSGYDDLIDLIELINTYDIKQFKDSLPEIFDVGEFLRAYAILNCVADIDQHFHNFLLIHSFHTDDWRICNWDHNATFRDPETPVDLNTREHPSIIGNKMNYLFDRLFHIDDFRYYYITKLIEYTNTIFSPEQMDVRIDNFVGEIEFDALRDIYKYGWENNLFWYLSVEQKKQFVRKRVQYIQNEAPKFLPVNFEAYKNKLFINEIFQSTNSSGFIEIYNNGLIPLDINDFFITDDINLNHKFTLSEKTIINGKKYYTISIEDIQKSDIDLSKSKIFFFSKDSTLLDSLSFPQLDNISFGRVYKNLDELSEFSFPTPNAPNIKTTVVQSPIVINEFMASNKSTIADGNGEYGDWIELYNNSDTVVDISGYYLTDDIETPYEWQIPADTKVAPRGFLLIWADGNEVKNEIHTTFKLSAKGESIDLFAEDGKTIIDSISFGKQSDDISYGRKTDASNDWTYFTIPTPNASNYIGQGEILPVVINELMASNSKTIKDEKGAYPDWIELYNNSDKEINISGYFVSDEPSKESTKWKIPDETIIKAHSFLLLWADNDKEDGKYHTNFKLSKDGDSVAIFSNDGVTQIDIIGFDEQQTDVSFGRKTDANKQWILFNEPTPNASNNTSEIIDFKKFGIELSQNYPNPFSDETKINIILNKSGYLSLKLYSILGEEIKTIYTAFINKGKHIFIINRDKLVSGIYFYRINFDGCIITRELVIE